MGTPLDPYRVPWGYIHTPLGLRGVHVWGHVPLQRCTCTFVKGPHDPMVYQGSRGRPKDEEGIGRCRRALQGPYPVATSAGHLGVSAGEHVVGYLPC